MPRAKCYDASIMMKQFFSFFFTATANAVIAMEVRAA
jgi:hypothetical protein